MFLPSWCIDQKQPTDELSTSLLPSCLAFLWASLIAQLVKNLPAMQETLIRFLGQEDPLEKRKAAHSNILGFPLWLIW